MSQYQKKHSPTHHPDHHPIFISFYHLLQSIASSLFKLHAWQSFCTTSLYVLFGLPLNSLLGTLSFTLTLHIHLISARGSATSFSFLTGQVSLPCSILLRTQLLYSLPFLINDISLLVSNGTNCLIFFHPIQILAFMAA